MGGRDRIMERREERKREKEGRKGQKRAKAWRAKSDTIQIPSLLVTTPCCVYLPHAPPPLPTLLSIHSPPILLVFSTFPPSPISSILSFSQLLFHIYPRSLLPSSYPLSVSNPYLTFLLHVITVVIFLNFPYCTDELRNKVCLSLLTIRVSVFLESFLSAKGGIVW